MPRKPLALNHPIGHHSKNICVNTPLRRRRAQALLLHGAIEHPQREDFIDIKKDTQIQENFQKGKRENIKCVNT